MKNLKNILFGILLGASIGLVFAADNFNTSDVTSFDPSTVADDSISGDKIDGGTISNFASTGIDDNATATKLTISDTGLGINDSTPDYPLDIENIGFDLLSLQRTNAGGAGVRIVDGSGNITYIISNNGTEIRAANNYNVRFTDAGGVSLATLIESNGRFGIGNTTPSTIFHVDSNAANTTAIQTLENTAGDIQIFRVDATPEGSVTGSRGDIATGIVNSEGALFIKHTGDATNTGWQQYSVSHYGEMYLNDNAVATVINTANIPHAVQGLFGAGTVDGFTFTAGSTGSITAFADYSGTVAGTVKATDVGHGLSTGAIITQTGTTNYNGIFQITVIDVDNYYFTDTWVADDATGTWYEGDKLVADTGSGGIYNLSFHGYGTSATANKSFEFEVYKNVAPQENVEAQRKFASADTGSMSGGGIVTIAAGDIITFAIIGLDDTTNFTLQHMNVTFHAL